MNVVPRTIEEAIIDWLFAHDHCRDLAKDVLTALAKQEAAYKRLRSLEEHIFTRCALESAPEFDLGDGRSVVVDRATRKMRIKTPDLWNAATSL